MKVAIYSRVLEEGQQKDVQLFFDELKKQKIEPVVFLSFFEQIKNKVHLPPETGTFFLQNILRMKLNLSSALVAMELCSIP